MSGGDAMNQYNKIKKIVEKNNGIIYAKDIEKNNINRYYIRELEKQGYLKRILHGIYALPEKGINEFWLMSQKYKKGIFSHNTALYFYGLTDRTPLKIDITFPSSMRVSNDYLKIHYIKNENLNLGVTTIELEKGIEVPVYDLERTICDIIRDKNKIDPQIFNMAMKEYGKKKKKNLRLLYKYSKEFKIENKLQQYMEVLG
mgnify:CR=1 FL=1